MTPYWPSAEGDSTMRTSILCALAVTAGLSFAVCATADEIMYMDSVMLQSTNYTSSVTVPRFDPSLGELTKVSFMLNGSVEGSARFESLDAEPAIVEMQLAAELTLQRPDMSTLVVTLPLVMTSDNADAFDGGIDFGGTSGKSYAGLSGSDSDMAMSTLAADLALFTGPAFMPGTITLPLTAMGASSGSGAGNLLLQFMTSAGAEVKVTYEYRVPEPASLGLLGLGGLTLIRRRRA